jgi:2-oxoglutarate ferredoxin oxidoreductase subunit gamma
MNCVEIRIAGTGGQGLILGAKMLAEALACSGRRVAQSQTYEPTSRGGLCTSDLVIASDEMDYPLATALDYLVLLDALAVQPSLPLVKASAVVIADMRLCPQVPAGAYRVHRLPLSRTALELGSERVTNIVALGALAALSAICQRAALEQAIKTDTPRSFQHLNLDALDAGYRLGAEVTGSRCAPGARTRDEATQSAGGTAPVCSLLDRPPRG